MTIRVYYEDTDSNGIVYHANYVKYCDRARSEEFFKNGIELQSQKGNLIIRKLEAQYLHPTYLGEELLVTARVDELNRVSTKIYHEIFLKKSMKKVFIMSIELVYLNENKTIDRLPDSFISLLKKNLNEHK